jgi:uncharacterized protein YndB with AHSA1/START domain
MARIAAATEIAAPAERVWDLVTDWVAHTGFIPLTTVTIDADSPVGSGVGTRFTGRTGIGAFGFADPMVVTAWQPPTDARSGYCRVDKLGPWVSGWAEIHCGPTGSTTTVRWVEVVSVRGVPDLLAPLAGTVGSLLFGHTLRRMAARLRDG